MIKIDPDQEERWWRVMAARDKSARGDFMMGVRTTGIYCTPGCPARTPLRRNVEFFASAKAAELAGFRACKRCKPSGELPRDPATARVHRACDRIAAQLDPPPSLRELAREAGVSQDALRRDFARALGISPREYADALRIRAFKSSIRKGTEVTEAIYEAGYGSSRGLYERAGKQLGMTPSAYRRGGEGMEIRYVLTNSPLGRLLVAGTQRGVCAVMLARPDRELVSSLKKEYPKAGIREGREGLGAWVREVTALLRGRTPARELPLDLRATAFQWRVWRELTRIPTGETRSYAEVARRIGSPKGARAVARACATNPVPLIIPCHRAVRGTGALGGYRWGMKVKEELLAVEERAGRKRRRPAPRKTASRRAG